VGVGSNFINELCACRKDQERLSFLMLSIKFGWGGTMLVSREKVTKKSLKISIFKNPMYKHPTLDIRLARYPNSETVRYICVYMHLKTPLSFNDLSLDYFRLDS